MPSTTDSAGGGAERPRAADAAVGLCFVAAAAAVVFGAMIPLQVGPEVARDRQLAANRDIPVEQLQQALTTVAFVALAVAVLYAAALVFFALRVRTGHRRARIGVVVLTVLAILPFSGQALLVVAVLVVADVLLFRRHVSAWLRSARPA